MTNKTHLVDFDNNINKVEFFSNDKESKLTVNGKTKWQSSDIGHEFTGSSMFTNCRNLIANW